MTLSVIARRMLAAAPLIALACSGDAVDPDPDPEDTADLDECAEDNECGINQICEDDACITGDRDDTFDGARTAYLVQDEDDPNVSTGLIHAPGDVDHFVYTASEPQWLRVWTQSNENAPEALNTVVSVFRDNGALHHFMDETGTGSLSVYDTRMQVYLPEAGTWYFRVEDISTFSGEGEPRGDQSWEYRFGIESWGSISEEPDSVDDTSIRFLMSNGTTIYPWGVLIDEDGDVDYTTAAMPHTDAPFEIWAPTDIPGSTLDARVEVRDAEGTLVLRKDSIGDTGYASYFQGYKTTWDVRVSAVDGKGGPNAWTVLYLRTRAEGYGNPREVEPNNAAAEANIVEQERYTNNGVTSDRGFLQGILSEPGDEDRYSISVVDGGGIRMVCSSSSYGSLGDVNVEVYDAEGASLGVFEDGDDSAPDVTLTDLSAGVHQLRFFEADGAGDPSIYYRCGVSANRP
ncbi:MAG: hypothetical protein AB8H79_11805 [Myxococcota bacterium]